MNKFVLALIAVMMLVSQVACTSESEESHNYIGTPGFGGFNRGRRRFGHSSFEARFEVLFFGGPRFGGSRFNLGRFGTPRFGAPRYGAPRLRVPRQRFGGSDLIRAKNVSR